jgi:hypothetical protein
MTTTRRDEALVFLRGALSRCDQEGCQFTDIVQVIKSWADTKNIAKPEWVAILPDRSNRPAPGDTVLVKQDSGSEFKGEAGIVKEIDDDDIGTLIVFDRNYDNDEWFFDEELLVKSTK